MTDKDQTVIFPLNGDSGLAEPVKSFAEFEPAEEQPTEFAAGLVSFAFIKAALRRSRRLWCITAAAGFLLGAGVYVSSPPSYKAVTSLLLTPGPYENINTAANNDQAMAESRAVAGLAEQKLGLHGDPGSFLASYTVAGLTERVLTITISAPSSSQAMLRASAVATAFLQYRAGEMQAQQRLLLASLEQQISQVNQRVAALTGQISQLSAQPSSPSQQVRLANLRAQRTQAAGTASQLQQSAVGNQTDIAPAVSAAVQGSRVLDAPSPLSHSRLKPLVLYSAIGIIVGLVLGMAIVVIRALLSDKMRRRDDIAMAIGAPVKLSVGTIRLNRRRPGRRDQLAADGTGVQRVAGHLDRSVAPSFRGTATLAVIPIDDPRVAAMSVVSLAGARAGQGEQIVLADLCLGAPAARLLGAGDPGVYTVDTDGGRVVVAVPEPEDVIPTGPLDRTAGQAPRTAFTGEVASACAAASLLLTLTTLDPSLGSEHLATWATDAVAVVTAGRSSWEKVHAAGELTRLSGTHLVSAVLVGADRTDESLGVAPAPEKVS